MSDATKRTCGCDWSLWETCDECNPDDEAAEIRRLRTRLAESEAEVGRLRDALEAVTECEEHRPCGLCRDRVRRAVEAKP